MVWDAKILDFRTFFDVFSMSFFKRASEDEKIDQNEPTRRRRQKFWAGLRCTGPSWGENIERGTRIFPSHLQQGVRCWCLVFDVEVFSLASRTLVHTFGGRRIEGPRGGHRRLPKFG